MKQNTKKLTTCAVLIALASVLSLVKVVQMPLGGSLTLLSMLPVVTISVMYGIKWGVMSSFIYSLVQLFFGITLSGALGWGLTPLSLATTLIVDYVLAYTLVGFAGMFRKAGSWGILAGSMIAIFGRFVCHFINGFVVFDIWCEWTNPVLYSFCYNGAYMLPEMLLTSFGVFALFKLNSIKRLCNF